jgi:hypothetical protein
LRILCTINGKRDPLGYVIPDEARRRSGISEDGTKPWGRFLVSAEAPPGMTVKFKFRIDVKIRETKSNKNGHEP